MPSPSCDQCHRKRLQCAGKKPACDHCIATRQICTYSTGRPVGKPKGHRNIKRNESLDLTPQSRMDDSPPQPKLDWTTSDSSPSFSDVNEAGSTFAMEPQARSAASRLSTSSTAGFIPTSTPCAALEPTTQFSPREGSGSMTTTFMPGPQNQLTDMEPINFTSVLTTMPVPFDSIPTPGPNQPEWQCTFEQSYPPVSTQFDTRPPRFIDSSAFIWPPSTLHDQYINSRDVFVTNAPHTQPAVTLVQGQFQSSSGQVDCHDLSTSVAMLFRSHFQSQNSDFDMALNLVHNCIEEATISYYCGRCSEPDQRRSMAFLMFLQQSLIGCQRLLSLATHDFNEWSHAEPSRKTTPNRKGPEKVEANLVQDLQASVRVSVVEAEVAKLRQLTDDFKASMLWQSHHVGYHPSFWPLLEVLDEAFTTLQQKAPCLKF